MGKKTGIQEALDLFDGSPTKLAAAVGGDVVRQNVEHWVKTRRVPADKCSRVSVATGIPVERLNPEEDWDLVRRALLATPKPEAEAKA